MKRTIGILAVLALLLPGVAGAVCTTVSVTSTTTKVLAAGDQGSKGRRWLWIINHGPIQNVYCDVGGGTNNATATLNAGFYIAPEAILPVPTGAYSSQTFPMAPNGEVDCITQTGTANVSACDN